MFVFRDAIVLIPNTRDKKRRKMSLVSQANKEDIANKQRILLPTSTTTLVPEELTDDSQQFMLDFTEASSDLSQTSTTHRFVLWCKDPTCRRQLVTAIDESCAPSAQMRKRNARKQNRNQSEPRKPMRLPEHCAKDHSSNCEAVNSGVKHHQLSTNSSQLTRSQSISPSRRNTQVDSGVFSDENDNTNSVNLS